MNIKDQDAIAASYGLGTGRELEQWLRSLSYLRNVAAHHSRMWNVNVLELSPVPQFDQYWLPLKQCPTFHVLLHHAASAGADQSEFQLG